jgi:hypothetical protein
MQLIEINSRIPEIEKAPHKIYILELSLRELRAFKLEAKSVLSRLPPFKDITAKTNLNVLGVDGDKGRLSHENVQRTHGIVMDFRPLGIYITFWQKPTPRAGKATRSAAADAPNPRRPSRTSPTAPARRTGAVVTKKPHG